MPNKPTTLRDIGTVCAECGISANVLTCLKKYGMPPKKLAFDVSTIHEGKCDYCGEVKGVTQVRDFFYPDFSLLRKLTSHNTELLQKIEELKKNIRQGRWTHINNESRLMTKDEIKVSKEALDEVISIIKQEK